MQDIEYSEKYKDDVYEYRHVILPRSIAKKLPSPMRLMTEDEWREIGVRQSQGWVHYSIHPPEPHILLFRRPLGTPTENLVSPTVTTQSKIKLLPPINKNQISSNLMKSEKN